MVKCRGTDRSLATIFGRLDEQGVVNLLTVYIEAPRRLVLQRTAAPGYRREKALTVVRRDETDHFDKLATHGFLIGSLNNCVDWFAGEAAKCDGRAVGTAVSRHDPKYDGSA